MELNSQQEDAVKYVNSPLQIIAGPGSGKSRVLIEKIKYLVDEQKYNSDKLLVVTFTTKASNELKERLRKDFGDKVENMYISTIHSFCQHMLEKFTSPLLGSTFSILDETEQYIMINQFYRFKFKLDNFANQIGVSELINLYNKLTENSVKPVELIKEIAKHKENEHYKRDLSIAQSYKYYLEFMLDVNDTKLDFALLQREFLRLLRYDENILNEVRNMFDYILIDEYQDTSPIQDEIFKLIAEPKFNITVVGDEDQSLYSFRGASIENFYNFNKKYGNKDKKVEIKKLETNYRSSKDIVSIYDNFMKDNRVFEKQIKSKKGEFSKPILITGNEDNEEAKQVVEFIKKLVDSKKAKYGDISILFNSVRNYSGPFVEYMKELNIPYEIKGDSALFEEDEVFDLFIIMAYLNEFEFPDKKYYDGYRYWNIFSSKLLNLSEESVKILKELLQKEPLSEIISEDRLRNLKIEQQDIKTLISLKNLRTNISKRKKKFQLKIFYELLDILNYHYRIYSEFVKNNRSEFIEVRLKNIAKFSDMINKFENNHTNGSGFKNLFFHFHNLPPDKMEDTASFEEQLDVVQLMTVHQSKGLEFPIVIMAGVIGKYYSHNNKDRKDLIEIPKHLLLNQEKENSYNKKEKERLFYVGISRAKDLLVISTSDEKGVKPSSFISEIGNDSFIETKDYDKKIIEHFDKEKEKIHLTYSGVNAYVDCGFRFWLTYIIGFSTPQKASQKYGVIVHNCLKNIHLMMKEGQKVEITDIIDVVDVYCRDEETISKYRDNLIDYLANYVDKIPNFIKQILEVETPFSYIEKDLVIKGQADLVIENKDNEIEIIDYKSFRKAGLGKVNVDTQLRIYNIGLKNQIKDKYGRDVGKLSAYTIEDNFRQPYSNTIQDIENTKKVCKSIVKDIENKVFKRNFGGAFCNTRDGRCPFYEFCNRIENNKL